MLVVLLGTILGFVIQWAFVMNLPDKTLNKLSKRRKFSMMAMGSVAAFASGVAMMLSTFNQPLEPATLKILGAQTFCAIAATVFIRRVIRMVQSGLIDVLGGQDEPK